MAVTAEPYGASRVLGVTRRFPIAEKTLSDLFLAHLKDFYYADKKIYRTLPTMVKAQTTPS
jgi:hypothetical protein